MQSAACHFVKWVPCRSLRISEWCGLAPVRNVAVKKHQFDLQELVCNRQLVILSNGFPVGPCEYHSGVALHLCETSPSRNTNSIYKNWYAIGSLSFCQMGSL